MLGAVGLYCGPLFQELVLVKLGEDVLGDVGLLLCGCSAEVVKVDLEPVIDFSVEFVVLVAELLGRDAL